MKKVYDFAYEKCVCACVCVCASARVNFNVAVSFITIRQHINCFVSNVFFLHLNLSEQTLTLSHFALAPRPAPKRKHTQYENWFSPRPSVWQVYSQLCFTFDEQVKSSGLRRVWCDDVQVPDEYFVRANFFCCKLMLPSACMYVHMYVCKCTQLECKSDMANTENPK